MRQNFSRYILTILVLGTALALTSCGPEEEERGGGTSPWQLFVSSSEVSGDVSLVDIPSNEIRTQNMNLLATNNPVTRMVNFRDYLFCFVPLEHKIVVLSLVNGDNFAEVETIDFSEEEIEPIDIAFGNATTAYVIFRNSNEVKVVDIHYLGDGSDRCRVCSAIDIGVPSSSIAVVGNRIFATNPKADRVSYFSTTTEKVQTFDNLAPQPMYIEAVPNGEEVVVISLGGGKRGDTRELSECVATFINVPEERISSATPIFDSQTTQFTTEARGIAITQRDYAFIPTNNTVLRIDLRGDRSRQTKILSRPMESIVYNPIRDEILLVEEGRQRLRIHSSTGAEIDTYALPMSPIESVSPR